MFKVSKGLNILLVVIALAAIYYFTQDYISSTWDIPFLILLIIFGAISILSILKKEEHIY